MWVHIPAAGGGINVESWQQVLKDMWLREKTVPLAGYSTQRKIQLHNIYRPTLFVSVVCSCKQRRINLLSYRHLYGTLSSSLTVAPSWSRRERTALSVCGFVSQPSIAPDVHTAVGSFGKRRAGVTHFFGATVFFWKMWPLFSFPL